MRFGRYIIRGARSGVTPQNPTVYAVIDTRSTQRRLTVHAGKQFGAVRQVPITIVTITSNQKKDPGMPKCTRPICRNADAEPPRNVFTRRPGTLAHWLD